MNPQTICWLGQDYGDYTAAYYQNDLFETFDSNYDVYPFGPGFDGYDETADIHEIVERIGIDPDLIVVANTWGSDDHTEDVFSHHAPLNLADVETPTLMFLNKEYRKLERKLSFIERNEIDYVTSVLKHRCDEWEAQTGSTFLWAPFGVNLDRFEHDPSTAEQYDFAFTGNLHEEWLDDRMQIKEHLFKPRYLDFSWWHNFVHSRRFEDRYDDLNIYWGEWQNRNIRFNSRAPFGDAYVALLNSCKTFLNTRSALGIFNPRFWELMATKTLIVCPTDDYYGLLEDGENCVMYDDLAEFDDLVRYYASHDAERRAIVDRAYETVDQYRWQEIVTGLVDQI